MALTDDIFSAIKDAGAKILANFDSGDQAQLQMFASDLVDLHNEAVQATGDTVKQAKAEAAKRIIDQAAELALSRINQIDDGAFDTLKKTFIQIVALALPPPIGPIVRSLI